MGLILSIIVTAWVAWMIARKGYAAAVLLCAGVVLLGASALLHLEPGLKLAKSTGSSFFDVFQVVQNVMSSNLGGLGLSIMAMGGFARYMDKLSAGRALYAVVGKPLGYIKSPYVLACMGFLVSQIIGIAIPSGSALALLLMVTLYPVLIQAGVSRATSVAIVASSRFFDLGPGSANCLLAAKTAGISWAEYFFNWQFKVYIPLLIVMVVSHYFVQKYWDRHEPADAPALQGGETGGKDSEDSAPKIFAILPIVPLAILLLFNPIVLGSYGIHVNVNVPAAIILSVLVAMVADFIRRRDTRAVLAGMKDFFEGMGKQLAVVVSLIVAGQIFGDGLIATGAVKTLIAGADHAAVNAGVIILVMGVIIGVISFLMGSGNAAFFSFAGLVPDIAAKLGIPAAAMLLPLQIMTGMGRTISPITGLIVAVGGIAGISPFRIVKRNLIPILLCSAMNFILTFVMVLN